MSSDALTMMDAFRARHSTRNFGKQEWNEGLQKIVEDCVQKANELPNLFGGEVEFVVAPTGFGMLNFIVNEKGWIFAKFAPTDDEEVKKQRYLEIGYKLEHVVMWLTQNKIATCWVAGTYKAGKAIEFCGGNCNVDCCIAFGFDDSDRFLDKTVKWFGSWRGQNNFEDQFYDKKNDKKITFDDAGERLDVCTCIDKIPCAVKPHCYKILFDEPYLHIYYNEGSGAYRLFTYIDLGITLTHVFLYYQSIGKVTKIEKVNEPPQYDETNPKYFTSIMIE